MKKLSFFFLKWMTFLLKQSYQHDHRNYCVVIYGKNYGDIF